MLTKILRFLVTLLLLTALVLTYISSLKICSEQCAEGSLYRLWGLPFELWGFVFFGIALVSHIIGYWNKLADWLTLWLLAGALGSELWFIYLQKYKIGHWCPICLSIAASVSVALLLMIALCMIAGWNKDNRTSGGITVRNIFGSWIAAIALIGGFFFALLGIEKMDPLKAAEVDFAKKIAFGKLDSPVEFYFFSDWQCPACRKLSPAMDKMIQVIVQKARLTFVDLPVHQETMNFSPYNLAFMVYNKDQYVAIRHVLEDLSTKTKTPSEQQINLAIKPLGITCTPLGYAEIAVGLKYYKDLAKRMGVKSTPTLVGVNTQTKKGKRLSGGQEISEENVVKMIDELSL